MEYLNVWLVAYLALGVFGGFLAGLLGIGGGMVLVPFLVMLFQAQGFPFETKMQVILATSMATIVFTAASSVRAHHAKGAVNWNAVWGMAPGILIGAFIGTRIVSSLSTQFLTIFFTAFLFYTGTQMLMNFKPKASRTLPGRGGLLAAGGTVGLLGSLVGAGGGFFSIPFLTWCNVAIHVAVGTSAALGFPIAAFATFGNVVHGWGATNVPQPSIGYIYLPALIAISIASVITAPFGARLTHKLPVMTLKRIFAVMLYLLALRMLYGIVFTS